MCEIKPIFGTILGSVKIFFMYGYHIHVFKLIFHGIIMLVCFHLKENIHKNYFLLQCYVT
jgi:hypothetical protein